MIYVLINFTIITSEYSKKRISEAKWVLLNFVILGCANLQYITDHTYIFLGNYILFKRFETYFFLDN